MGPIVTSLAKFSKTPPFSTRNVAINKKKPWRTLNQSEELIAIDIHVEDTGPLKD